MIYIRYTNRGKSDNKAPGNPASADVSVDCHLSDGEDQDSSASTATLQRLERLRDLGTGLRNKKVVDINAPSTSHGHPIMLWDEERYDPVHLNGFDSRQSSERRHFTSVVDGLDESCSTCHDKFSEHLCRLGGGEGLYENRSSLSDFVNWDIVDTSPIEQFRNTNVGNTTFNVSPSHSDEF